MANVQGPYGFSQIGTASGPPNFAENHNPPYRIASGYATAIFKGDLVRMNVSGPTGYIEQWANGDGATATKIVAGVFVGCRFYSTAARQWIWSNYWPGSGATGDVYAFVVDDPQAQFMVQAGIGSAITQASIGQNADIVASPDGNETTGISGMSLSTPTTTATLPMKVMNVITTPPGANGTDLTTPYNNVVVSFNNVLGKALLGV
jgi:hypothetical protein